MSSALTATLVCLASACLAFAGGEEPKPQPPVTPPSVRQIQTQAEAARKQNRIEAAVALYKKGVGIEPNWEEGWWSLGTLQYVLWHFAEAPPAFPPLSVIQPTT